MGTLVINSAEIGEGVAFALLVHDEESGKLTCISIYGIDGTRRLIAKQEKNALDALEIFGDRAAFFAELVRSMVGRTH